MPTFRHNAAKWLAIVAAAIMGGYLLLIKLPDYNRNRNEQREYQSLWEEYINPEFSAEYCEYWKIDSLPDYRKELKQQFDTARAESLEESYGETEDEILHFHRLRMINWLERQLIERAENRLMFERRGEDKRMQDK
jgi:hypothetical protein